MRRRHLPFAVVAAAALALGLVVPTAAVATNAQPAKAPTRPSIRVHPTYHLANGSQIHVQLAGLPPNTIVQLAQCNAASYDPTNPKYGCAGANGLLPTARTTAGGRFSTEVTLSDPLFPFQDIGNPAPIYCRADQCRIFAEWSDSSGNPQYIRSVRLHFPGKPVTITATPDTNLNDGDQVLVTGTALGAQGRTVQVTEGDCYDIIQGEGCEGNVQLGSAIVAPGGAWQVSVNVQRVLPDGVDCADPGDFIFDSWCQLTPTVLTTSGQPDDTYGVSHLGLPRAILTFLSPGS